MITIYHNPRCSKSRAALMLAEDAADRLDEGLQVIDYQKASLTLAELQRLQAQLALPVRALLRDGEAPYAELGLADPALSDAELLTAIAAHPILLQRPIVVRGERAVIGRPPENALALLD